ncbi:hypothetical protein NLJ89_g5843 [Agrocybe chaxingu]|uniref:Kinetochore protein Sos7 coiled-coil domain-containing protein n=1 Tax=Agrocybe chaxingu TaxID=84603 RepID=A0A9W8MV81_9AGAR|nr:hypothetical protein NLJ89_g5843 [Agrocybe chaxingu]
MSRPSLELSVEPGQNVQAARQAQARLQAADLRLVKKAAEFNAHRKEDEEELEGEETQNKDPAIVAMDLAAQIAYLRKLKFQYLEQNAKDKYVKSIVSDIDDAPIVTAEQNKDLALTNEEKKEKLKAAKANLAEARILSTSVGGQTIYRVLADYQRVKQATDRADFLSQKIIDARTSLMVLRQTHPRPRLTIPLAEHKLADQVTEMQTLSDEIQALKQKAKTEKGRVRAGTLEVEELRTEAAEAQKSVKALQGDEEDSRLVPLCDWYTASLTLQRSICNLEDSSSESENELRLTYKVDQPPPASPHRVVISLIFAPDTRRLADAQVSGLEELGVDLGDLIDAHIQVNDVHGLVAAVLARARAAVSS